MISIKSFRKSSIALLRHIKVKRWQLRLSTIGWDLPKMKRRKNLILTSWCVSLTPMVPSIWQRQVHQPCPNPFLCGRKVVCNNQGCRKGNGPGTLGFWGDQAQSWRLTPSPQHHWKENCRYLGTQVRRTHHRQARTIPYHSGSHINQETNCWATQAPRLPCPS